VKSLKEAEYTVKAVGRKKKEKHTSAPLSTVKPVLGIIQLEQEGFHGRLRVFFKLKSITRAFFVGNLLEWNIW